MTNKNYTHKRTGVKVTLIKMDDATGRVTVKDQNGTKGELAESTFKKWYVADEKGTPETNVKPAADKTPAKATPKAQTAKGKPAAEAKPKADPKPKKEKPVAVIKDIRGELDKLIKKNGCTVERGYKIRKDGKDIFWMYCLKNGFSFYVPEALKDKVDPDNEYFPKYMLHNKNFPVKVKVFDTDAKAVEKMTVIFKQVLAA